jgi:hypothetical protein
MTGESIVNSNSDNHTFAVHKKFLLYLASLALESETIRLQFSPKHYGVQTVINQINVVNADCLKI